MDGVKKEKRVRVEEEERTFYINKNFRYKLASDGIYHLEKRVKYTDGTDGFVHYGYFDTLKGLAQKFIRESVKMKARDKDVKEFIDFVKLHKECHDEILDYLKGLKDLRKS